MYPCIQISQMFDFSFQINRVFYLYYNFYMIKILLLTLLVVGSMACPEGQLTINGQCTPVNYIQGCVQYISADTCALCEYGYSMGNGKCEYAEKPVTECCVLMDSNGVCVQCAPGLYLDGNSCAKIERPGCLEGRGLECTNCAAGFQNLRGRCYRKLSFCASYTEKGTCSQCQAGYELIRGLCSSVISVPTTSNCKSANQYGCVQCEDGYFLTANRECRVNEAGCLKYYREACQICSRDYKLINNKCVMEGCSAYSSTGCTKCSQPYSLLDGKCLIDNCLDSLDGQCIVCHNEYRLKNGRCVKPIADRCNSCANGYFVGQNGKCYKLVSGCASYGADGKCQRCDDPFILSNGLCTIPGCEKVSSKGCVTCLRPFELSFGRCVLSQCQEYNYQSLKCKVCKTGFHIEQGLCVKNSPLCSGYTLKGDSQICTRCSSEDYILTELGTCEARRPGCVYQFGKCISCAAPFKKASDSTCYIEGCLEYNWDGCTKCNAPYQQRRGSCLVPNCNEIRNGRCVQCSSGFRVNSFGGCFENDPKCAAYTGQRCDKCISGYMFNVQGYCVREIAFCKVLGYERCEQCQGGYQLVNGNCFIVDKYCETYDEKLQGCIRCVAGYHSESGSCRLNDQSCAAYDSSAFTQRCTRCATGYVYTTDGLNCVKQTPGCIYNAQGKCTSCRAPFTFNGKVCVIYACSKYSDTGCYECEYPTVRQDDTCVIPFCEAYEQGSPACQKCRAGYKMIQGKCYREDPKCIDYTRTGQCTRCVKQYTLFEGVCVKEDQYCSKYSKDGGCNKCKDKYYVSADSICLPEEPGCVYQKGKCAYCNYPFKMHEASQKCRIDGCLEAIPAGCTKCKYPYEKNQNNICQIPNCAVTEDNRCARCNPGYHLKSGLTCVKDDPSCLKYNEDGDCQLCDKGYMLMSSGECQLAEDNCVEKGKDGQCSQCKAGYFVNKFFQCQLKDKYCEEYNNGICTACTRRYFLYQFICFPYSPGCVEYSGKDCIKCKSSYTLRNGECFSLRKPALKLQGEDQKYDFDITPIDITKSKYYIDNLSPVSKLGKVFYSSFFSLQFTDPRLTSEQENQFPKGWKAENARSGEYIGYTITDAEPATFYAIQIEGVEGNYIREFYLEYSVDDVNYIRVEKEFNSQASAKGLTTIYFTGIYAKSIRIVVKSFYGWPAARIEFFYYDMIRFRKISNLKSLKYLKESIQSNFVDRMDNQMYINQRSYFRPSTTCQNKSTCFTGLELCQQRQINWVRISTTEGILRRVYMTYSVDGVNFNCFEKCRHFVLDDKLPENNLMCNGISARNVRVYPVEWTGTPNIKISYDYS